MTNGTESLARRQAAAVQRLDASRTRLRAALIGGKPAGGWASGIAAGLSGLAGLSDKLAALIQRHPGFSAAGAVVLGALLARARPWRWALSSGLWAMLMPRVLPTLLSSLTAARLGLWSELITAWLNAETRTSAPTPTRAATSAAGTPARSPTSAPTSAPIGAPASAAASAATSASPGG